MCDLLSLLSQSSKRKALLCVGSHYDRGEKGIKTSEKKAD